MTDAVKIITSNKKATFEYHIEERIEAGLVLTGTEVKALRAGKANLQDAFCNVEGGEMIMRGCHIAPYDHGNRANHEPTRSRKLLLHRREIEKLDKSARQKGYTIVPLKLYFKNGKAKIEIGLGKGKKLYDKRADIADRESNRRLDRLKVEFRKGGD
jgi:SsrA-binding protein